MLAPMDRVLLATLVAVAACTAGMEETDATVAAQRVAIPALRSTLDVPAGTKVILADDGATLTTRPGTRAPRTIGIHARASAGPGELRRVLAAEVSVTYTLQTHEGGSGGAESVLAGDLQVGARRFAVTCHDQAEWPASADATWCLAYLATMRLD